MSEKKAIESAARLLVGELLAAGRTVATAESCTGGWIAKALTDVSGSSGCFGYGFVSYSNEAKTKLLDVNAATLAEHGAVSEATVLEMTAGALSISGADYAVAVSGIAGPDGGTTDKPVGTVWFAWQTRGGQAHTELCRFDGGRDAVRAQTVVAALERLRERLREDA